MQRPSEDELLSPGLVHELRQPLTGLDARLRLVARDLGVTLTGLESWRLATDQVARMVEVLDTYERLMAPEGGAPASFAADVVVRRVVAAQRHRLDALPGGFALVIEPGVPPAHGAPQALAHAVSNLVVNALEAVEARGGRVEVRVLAAAGPAAQVRVSDDGAGIAPGDRDRLFTRRFTTKASGSGLGLAIARRMMRAAGGEVRLVPDGDPARRPWARTEFAVDLAASAHAPAARAPEPAVRRHRGRVAAAVAGLAAAALLALGWTTLHRRVAGVDEVPAATTPPALEVEVVQVAETTGTVERLRGGAWRPVAPGERLDEDDSLRTAAGGRATLAVGERSRLTVSGSTQLTVRELTAAMRRLRLARGRISVDHQPDGARVLVVESDRGESIARGVARFSVLASGTALAVATDAGVVRLEAGGRGVDVGAGQQSVAFGGAPPVAPAAIPVALLLEVARAAALADGNCRVQGRVDPGAEVLLEGRPVRPGADGRFDERVAAPLGTATVALRTRDAAGRTQEQRVRCARGAPPVVSDFAVRWGQE